MKQAGRKSAAALSVVTALPLRTQQPPEQFTPDEVVIWERVVASKPSDWWDAGSLPLLAQYCRASVQADLVAEAVGAAANGRLPRADGQIRWGDWLARYKELRQVQASLSNELNSLARSMRLTQQSRYTAKTSETARKKAGGKRPWD